MIDLIAFSVFIGLVIAVILDRVSQTPDSNEVRQFKRLVSFWASVFRRTR